MLVTHTHQEDSLPAAVFSRHGSVYGALGVVIRIGLSPPRSECL
jgi:hypothetical protein